MLFSDLLLLFTALCNGKQSYEKHRTLCSSLLKACHDLDAVFRASFSTVGTATQKPRIVFDEKLSILGAFETLTCFMLHIPDCTLTSMFTSPLSCSGLCVRWMRWTAWSRHHLPVSFPVLPENRYLKQLRTSLMTCNTCDLQATIYTLWLCLWDISTADRPDTSKWWAESVQTFWWATLSASKVTRKEHALWGDHVLIMLRSRFVCGTWWAWQYFTRTEHERKV